MEEKALDIITINLNDPDPTDIKYLLTKLQEKGFIKLMDKDHKTVLTRNKLYNIEVTSWIDEYRQLFAGKKPGSMGDRKSCIAKMEEFLMENREVTKDIVLRATRYYIDNINNYTYLMKADNFISVSKDNTKIGRRSELRAYCDEIMSGATNDERIDSI